MIKKAILLSFLLAFGVFKNGVINAAWKAVQRLGQAEDALESQRNQGRGTRSAVFNRMLAEKLMLSGMLERFRFYGLKL